MNVDIEGFEVIVTGGTRGIGKAVTELFLRGKCSVTAVYSSNEVAAAELSERWQDYPLQTVKLDVADYDAVEQFYCNFDTSHEKLDVLVNCAGIRRDAVVGMMSSNAWQSVIDINLTGTFNMSKFAVQKMMQNRFGRIISITSPSGRIGIAGQANYAASKAGQVALTKSLSKEVARRGITVNCISPGFIETELIADLEPELSQTYRNQVPLKRFGKPTEIADSVAFIASHQAAYITGETLEISGGL